MKIVRLKKGVRLHLSDHEWEAMCVCIDYARGDLEEETATGSDPLALFTPQGRQFVKRHILPFDGLAFTEDRRAKAADGGEG